MKTAEKTTTKHTAEPWEVDPTLGRNAVCARSRTGRPFRVTECVGIHTHEEDEANAARIVACVNACAGKKDPQAYMDAVDAVLRAFDMADVMPHQRHALEALRPLGG